MKTQTAERSYGFSPEPKVRLMRAFPNAFESVITSARTCYSSRGLVTSAPLDERARRLARSLYDAGHHTTFQHAYFQFALVDVSRLFVWSFLHAHPFYNSEQVSQRYVPVRPENVIIPPLEPYFRHRYGFIVERLMDAYHVLVERLYPIAESAYFQRFPGRRHRPEKYRRAIEKKAMEVARYVLPLGTTTYLYHTISAITLLRYWRACKSFDVPTEQTLVAEAMIQQVLEHEPAYRWVLEEPLEPDDLIPWPLNRHQWPSQPEHRAFVTAFDEKLGHRISRLEQATPDGERVLAEAVRSVLGYPENAIPDDEAIALALDPARQRGLGGSLNLTMHMKIPRALVHVTYTFRKKISHSADAQDQRHRAVPGSRPIVWNSWTGEPDYITPVLIRVDPQIERFYDETMVWLFEQIERLLMQGMLPEYAAYLLPNAYPVRFFETGDLLGLRHKLAMRLCYNAQEEIWRASLEEWQQIRQVHPLIGQYLGPPCELRERAGTKPFCPEGERFCGVRVWELEPEAYERTI